MCFKNVSVLSAGTSSNKYLRSFISKNWRRTWEDSIQSIKKCLIFTFKSIRMHESIWPIVRRVRTTSSRLDDRQMVFLPRTCFTSFSLLKVTLSHDICHLDKMKILIKGLKSVHGSVKFEIPRSSEAFAFTSAASLPLMPTLLGSQQKIP